MQSSCELLKERRDEGERAAEQLLRVRIEKKS